VLKRELQNALGAGSAVGGFCQLAPPSVLRQIPPPFTVRLSPQAEAITICALPGSNFTSDIRNGCNESICVQVAPEFAVLNSPPLSLAAIATAELDGLTSTATVRPPHFTFGWKGVTAGIGSPNAGPEVIAPEVAPATNTIAATTKRPSCTRRRALRAAGTFRVKNAT
jgi:hypothetical protein